MNKKILLLGVVFVVILIILLVILAQRKSTTGNNVTPTQSTQSVKLIWWNLFEPQANVQPLIDAYTALHPNVQIQYTQMGLDSIDAYKNELEVNLKDNDVTTGPDIFTVQNTWAGEFQNLITKAPSSQFSETDLTDFYPIVKTDFYRNGGVNAVPLYMDAIAVIYNKKKLAAKGYSIPAPLWSDFQIQAEDLTERDAQQHMISGGFSAYSPASAQFYFEVFNQLLLQNAVSMTDYTGKKSDLKTQTRAQDTLDFYTEFYKGRNNTWDETMKKDIAAFLENHLAMYAAPSWRLINILDYNSKYNLGLDIGVAQMPQLSGGAQIYWPSYWGQTVSKDSQNSEEAWKFIRFITSTDELKLLDKTVKDNGRPIGIIFPRLSMSDTNKNDPLLGPYAASISSAQDWEMKDSQALKAEFDTLFTNQADIDGIEAAINKIIGGN
jgi:ABC-type glycerol-3-phosphate transport system substrate-binding protein